MSEIGLMRLHNLHVNGDAGVPVESLVQHLGAVQAQDYPMACWALGVRVPRLTLPDVENAISRSSVIRTHVLRPTWHFIPADDARWMIELSADRIRGAIRAYDRMMGIEGLDTGPWMNALASALAGGKILNRQSIADALNRAGCSADDLKLSHLLMNAEQDGLVCSGLHLKGKPTYRLMSECIPPHNRVFSKEEAAAELARRYFTSHGPAQLIDFSWWSGLPAGAARRALESVSGELQSFTENGKTYWMSGDKRNNAAVADSFLLPAFDEFLVGYRDRSDVLPAEFNRRVITVNGIFRPVVVHNGRVIGLWSRAVKPEAVKIEIALFGSLSAKLKQTLEVAAARYGEFLNQPVVVEYKK